MERFLVLTLVVGLASLASGGFVITTDGTEVLSPVPGLNMMTLGIANDTTMTMFEGHTLALIVNDSAATITGGEVGLIQDFVGTIPGDVQTNETIVNPPETNGVWLTTLALSDVEPQILFYDLVLTCISYGTAVVELYEIEEGVPFGNPLDIVVIYQPEPTTIALFALGGLFLRRRR
jgi:hypothetical protein